MNNKTRYIVISFITLLSISCNRKHNCVCTESYQGANKSYSNVTETELTGMKTDEAREECDKGDVGPQHIFSETWGIDCELK